jgi:putative SOS response-associated peptidase YedK
MQWGPVPFFSKDGKPTYSTINARAESVRAKAINNVKNNAPELLA